MNEDVPLAMFQKVSIFFAIVSSLLRSRVGTLWLPMGAATYCTVFLDLREAVSVQEHDVTLQMRGAFRARFTTNTPVFCVRKPSASFFILKGIV